jgi:cytochrome c-type biogenesis protein CcmH/NrfF
MSAPEAATSAPPKSAPGRPDPQAEAVMQELSHDLMSPYCPGRTIATCPSPQARKLEAQILEQAEHGKTRAEIESDLAARFPGIRGYVGRPELIWGTAAAAIVALALIALAARRWVRGGRGRDRAVAAASPDAAALARPGAVEGQPPPSRREIDALDDALDRVDEF